MAREFVEILSSDLSGVQSDDAVGVGFSLDGNSYEIDLTSDETAELEAVLKPYVAKARKATTGGGSTRRSASASRRRAEVAALRAWLKLRGRDVPDRGRVRNDWVQEWIDEGKPGL